MQPYFSSISMQKYTSSISVPAFNAPVLLDFCANCESLSQLSWKSSPPLSLFNNLLQMCFSHFSPSSSLGNRATPRILSWINVPKWSLSTFIYPIRVILMTFHLQRLRLDLGQEIYGWDLIFHSLKSPKWTLHEIFLFEKSHHPKY